MKLKNFPARAKVPAISVDLNNVIETKGVLRVERIGAFFVITYFSLK
jgi:hypothetical protein